MSQAFFFIGIGGSGMSPLALIAHSRGYMVQGYDRSPSKNTELLKEQGILVHIGDQNLVDISGYTVVVSSAIADNNPYMQQALVKQLKVLHRSDLLQQILQNIKYSICVSGSHGKTTTTAMLAYLLQALDKNPSAYVGGQMRNYQSPALCGGVSYMVAEADESDGTFLKYRPYCAVLTNADLDHLDFYQGKENLFQAFSQFITELAPGGLAVINAQDAELCPKHIKALTFSVTRDADFMAKNVRYFDEAIHFDLQVKPDGRSYPVVLSVIGMHNVENALAALAALYGLGLSLSEATVLFKGFQGVRRRLEVLHKDEKLGIIDDYAHNPGKIAAAISAVKMAYPHRKLLVIFQPHRFSRVKSLYQEFTGAFKGVDLCIVLPVYAAGEVDTDNFSLAKFALDIKHNSDCKTELAPTFMEASQKLRSYPKEAVIVMSLGAGSVTDFGPFHLSELYENEKIEHA